MSLFKAREWWSTTVGDNEMFDVGCLCVSDLNSSGSDKLIIGSYHGRLAIYQPSPSLDSQDSACKADHVVCEMQLSSPILQVEAGRFVSGSEAMHVAVLHPRKLIVFGLSTVPGLTEHGVQYQLRSLYEHKFQRTSFNFCYGPFGGVKGRDFICVQSMDGTISIFEQESFSFTRFLPGALLPGPIRYIGRTDSIITVTSSRQVDSFKFQVLATAKDDTKKEESPNVMKGKRVTADWSLIIDEMALDLVVTNFTGSVITIFVLGERNLYALSEGGQLVFMKKFDFSPACFIPYGAGKNDTVRYLVASQTTNTILVFENMTLMWAAQLMYTPVQIRIANFRELAGMIVTVDDEGHLSCVFLGTDPSLVSHPTSYHRQLDYTSIESEMKQLQQIIKEQQTAASLPTPSLNSDEDLKLTLDIPSVLDKISKAVDIEIEEDVPVPSVTVKVLLTAKSTIHNVKLICSAVCPLVSCQNATVLPSVAPGSPVETDAIFYMKHRLVPTDLKITVLATYYTSTGAPRVVRATGQLPLSLVLRQTLPAKSAAYKLTLTTNKQPVNLTELFPDLCSSASDASSNAVGLKYYGTDAVITILAAKNSQRYRVQCDSFGLMWHVLNELFLRLANRFKMGASSDFKISYEDPLPLNEYGEVIDQHFQCRTKKDVLMAQLSSHAAQFRATEKRLLILFKDKTPTPLKNLDTLLDMSYKQIMMLTDAIQENSEQQERISAELSCSTRIIVLLMRLILHLPQEEVVALEAVLSPTVYDSSALGWEEIVDAAVTHILRTSLAKSAKDVTFNPKAMTPLKDVDKLKKHIVQMCDCFAKGARITGSAGADHHQNQPASKSSTKSLTTNSVSRGKNDFEDSSQKSVTKTKKKTGAELDSEDYSDLLVPNGTSGLQQRNLHQQASGELSRSSGDHWEATSGLKDYRKKSNKASDEVPDLDAELPADDDDITSALRGSGNEIVYGL